MEVHGSHQHWEEDFPISEKASIGSSIALSQPKNTGLMGIPPMDRNIIFILS